MTQGIFGLIGLISFISRDIHMNAKGHAAQIVVTAVQIFSRTVGSCFELAEMPAHAYFCYTVNNYFDVMNSSKVLSNIMYLV